MKISDVQLVLTLSQGSCFGKESGLQAITEVTVAYPGKKKSITL